MTIDPARANDLLRFQLHQADHELAELRGLLERERAVLEQTADALQVTVEALRATHAELKVAQAQLAAVRAIADVSADAEALHHALATGTQ